MITCFPIATLNVFVNTGSQLADVLSEQTPFRNTGPHSDACFASWWPEGRWVGCDPAFCITHTESSDGGHTCKCPGWEGCKPRFTCHCSWCVLHLQQVQVEPTRIASNDFQHQQRGTMGVSPTTHWYSKGWGCHKHSSHDACVQGKAVLYLLSPVPVLLWYLILWQKLTCGAECVPRLRLLRLLH